VGVGVGGQLYGSKTSHPFESIIFIMNEVAPIKVVGVVIVIG
jgi:hypothetical protein